MNPHVQRGCLRPSYGRSKYTLILKKNAETLFKAVHCITISFNIREDINRKKTDNVVLVFGRQKFTVLTKMSVFAMFCQLLTKISMF